MKKGSVKYVFGSVLALGMLSTVIGCNNGGNTPVVEEFDFAVALASGRKEKVYLGETDRISCFETNAGTVERSYDYKIVTSGGDEFLSVSSTGVITPKKETTRAITIKITEKASEIEKRITLTVAKRLGNATGGYNYASDEKARLDILGKLEEYAMENHLTGMPLFENGGYVRYADAGESTQKREDNRKVHLGTKDYITGYGFGLLREGYIEGTLKNGSSVYPTYMHTATASDPANINAWNATGSQVSDLNGYISGSYWSTKMDGTSKYKWYPLLAKSTVGGKEFSEPIPLEPENELKMYRQWRIYVKTGEEGTGKERIAYRTASTRKDGSNQSFDKRPVKLEDYEFTYKMLLSEPAQLTRGSELANDTSYGIKGGASFFRNTKGKTAEEIDLLWKGATTPREGEKFGDLGIKTGKDDEGSYIDIEILNPVDSFTAMYTLSGNLYTPIPQEFMEVLGDGDWVDGASNYGYFQNNTDITDNVICIGPYYLSKWDEGQTIVFTRNDDWYEVDDRNYRIPGIYQRILTAGAEQSDFLYRYFLNGELDSTGIPSTRIQERLTSDLQTKGDSTFKLNVNSCSQDRWNELFGANGSIEKGKDNDYQVKPWMSNSNFLNGLFWSINRKAFADKRGVAPSIEYLSGAYMSDPKEGTSYNKTAQHANAIRNFHDAQNEDYGYNVSKAITYFQAAVSELVAAGDLQLGTASDPTKISIHIKWMYQSDPKEYGEDIKNYFQTAFNDPAVCGGRVVLDVTQDAVTDWQQVYNDYLMRGKYDLGFGAISGNTYNPLNFLEVLKSDNSSGFTLNWGNDTGKVDPINTIEYDGRSWSFDALWTAADHGTVTSDGKDVDPVNHCYIAGLPKDLDGKTTNVLYGGCQISTYVEFVDLTSAEADLDEASKTVLQVSKVQLYLGGAGSYLVPASELEIKKTGEGKYTVTITLSAESAANINNLLVTGNKLDEKAEKEDDQAEKFNILHPFKFDNYGFWEVEIFYTLSIRGVTSETVKYAFKTKTDDEASKKNLALARL